MNKVRLLALVPALCAVTADAHAASFQDPGFEKPTLLSLCGKGCNLTGLTIGQTIGPWSVVGPGATGGGSTVLIIGKKYAEGSLHFQPSLGAQALDLTGSFNQGLNGVQQTVSTSIGKSYTITFDIGHADRDAYLPTSLVQVTVNGTPVGTFDNSDITPNQINWRRATATFTATATQTTIGLFNASTNSNYVGLDNVKIARTPAS